MKKKKVRGLGYPPTTSAQGKNAWEKWYFRTLPKDGTLKSSLGKAGIDIVGTIIGTMLVSAIGPGFMSSGLASGLIGLGQFDNTGVLRVIGASALGYSISKGSQSGVNGVGQTQGFEGVKERLTDLKKEWLSATYLDRLFGDKKAETSNSVSGFEGTDGFEGYPESQLIEGLEEGEFDSLDAYDQENHQRANEFDQGNQVSGSDFSLDFDDEDPLEGLGMTYSIMSDKGYFPLEE